MCIRDSSTAAPICIIAPISSWAAAVSGYTSGDGFTLFLQTIPFNPVSYTHLAGHKIVTLEGMQKEAQGFAEFIADQGAEQCGFCNPGMMMNVMALLRENDDPSDEDILNYLAGNLCRCSGYEGQLRGIKNYIAYLKRSGKEDLS